MTTNIATTPSLHDEDLSDEEAAAWLEGLKTGLLAAENGPERKPLSAPAPAAPRQDEAVVEKVASALYHHDHPDGWWREARAESRHKYLDRAKIAVHFATVHPPAASAAAARIAVLQEVKQKLEEAVRTFDGGTYKEELEDWLPWFLEQVAALAAPEVQS